MRFAAASKNNASNYATAGAHIINASTDIQQAIANRKPDYTGIAITAMDAALLEKQAALKAKTAVDTAGLKAVAGVKEAELTADSRVAAAQSMADAKINVAEMDADVQELKDKRRMAGKLSALGALAAKTAIKRKKVDRPEPSNIDYASQQDEILAKLEVLRKQREALDLPTDSPPSTSDGSQPTTSDDLQPLSSSLPTSSDAWTRFSRVIRAAEGTSGDAGYNTMFGGGRFTDMSRHPDTVIHTDRYSSAAAGAYQFMPATWNRAAGALGLTDFSPTSQEAAGRWLVQQRDVNPDAIYETKDQFAQAIDRLAPEWAGLPNLYGPDSKGNVGTNSSFYGQGGKSLDTLWNIYQSNL